MNDGRSDRGTRPNDDRKDPLERRGPPRFRTRALTDGNLAAPSAATPHAFLGSTVNVSSGGALVRTYEKLEIGQEVALTLRLPEGDLAVHGRVTHVEADPVGCHLAGVRFEVLAEDQQAILAAHLRTVTPDRRPSSTELVEAAAPQNGWPVDGTIGDPVRS